ncbi:MAG: IS30 family transposase, partial [Candidatus Terrybacteria bacterium]|nr:IS30 family transposase [Candidatus Terrybacteria bacterium]
MLERYIHEKIKLGWSPERIAGRLRLETGYSISFKAVYKYLLYNPFGWPLIKYLKRRGRKRKKKSESKWGEIIKNRVFIGQRSGIINARLRYGDFEADTMGRTRDASSETLAVIRERKSRYIMARKVNQLKFAIDGFKELFSLIPVKSITFDNGPENARYHELKADTYFCDPYSSWQKGSVENGIGLIREYIP